MKNKKGIALIMAYGVVAVLAALASAFMLSSAAESKAARKYIDSTNAFWIAEAGLAQGYRNWTNGSTPAQLNSTASFGGGSYTINANSFPLVSIAGTYGSATKTVQANFIRIPSAFDNTLSVGGNLSLNGLLARVDVYNKTRISGTYSQSAGASSYFDDKQTGISQNQTTITVPDYNGNGTPNEFSDFTAFGHKAAASYPANQVVYIQSNGTVNVFPNSNMVGKKILFVEGSSPGTGNVNIFFDTTWQGGEDLTIISTGNITYVEPLQFQEPARLSTISWDDYSEGSIFRSEHESVIYSHGDSNFVDILDWGSTTGNIIANGNVSLNEVLTYEKYYYSNRSQNGDMPPGFQWLSAGSGTSSLKDWQSL